MGIVYPIEGLDGAAAANRALVTISCNFDEHSRNVCLPGRGLRLWAPIDIINCDC